MPAGASPAENSSTGRYFGGSTVMQGIVLRSTCQYITTNACPAGWPATDHQSAGTGCAEHTKKASVFTILAKKERFFVARQEWAPGRRDDRGWHRALLDMTRASEHDTLHHCLQPCCGPRPPLRLSLCAATAAEGKISWRPDVSAPSSCSGLPSPLQPHGAAATATGGGQ